MNKLVLSNTMQDTLLDLLEGKKTENLSIFVPPSVHKDLSFAYKEGEFAHYLALQATMADFGIDDARELATKAYISSHGTRYVIAYINAITLEAQNALLKVLEEPPSDTEIILLASSKDIFIRTIRSRLIVQSQLAITHLAPLPLDIDGLSLGMALSYLNSLRYVGKEDLKEIVQALLLAIARSSIALDEEELGRFDFALKAASSYENAKYLLAPLLLMIVEKRR